MSHKSLARASATLVIMLLALLVIPGAFGINRPAQAAQVVFRMRTAFPVRLTQVIPTASSRPVARDIVLDSAQPLQFVLGATLLPDDKNFTGSGLLSYQPLP
jgi:hypothetical protein